MELKPRIVAVVLVLTLAEIAGADDKPDPATCPMHAEHQAPGPAHGDHAAGVDRRHDDATGVGHADSVHHFTLTERGGVIRLEVRDAADTTGRDRIRTHLASIAEQFAQGRFDVPTTIHDRVPPGVPEMRRLKASIRYAYEPTANGGRVLITTGDTKARAAIHAFLRFQIDDHRTGDAKEIAPGPDRP
jgi:hypothetical protein